MTSKKISNNRPVGGDYFFFQERKLLGKSLNDFLPLFNPDDYWIYKMTRHQHIVSYEEFLEFKYASYIFFKKEKYKKEYIDKWLEWFDNFDEIKFLSKHLPSFPVEKIIIL